MKVVLLTQLFPPESVAGARRAGALADALAEVADVEVVTLKPAYPNPSIYRDTIDRFNFPVRRTGVLIPHKHAGVRRAVAELVVSARLGLEGARSRPDVVFASSPTMFLGPAAAAVARHRGIPWIWDLRDLTWEYVRERSAGPHAILASAVAPLMWRLARSADAVLAATPGIASRCVAAGVVPDRLVSVPNRLSRCDVERLSRIPPRRGVSARRATVSYIGLVGYNQDVGVLVDVADRLPEVDFEIVGDGPELPAIRARARGLSNVSCKGFVRAEELPAAYARADILFAQIKDSRNLNEQSLPSKLFEYMATERPVIFAGRGLAADYLRANDCAVVVPPSDPEAIAGAVRRVLADAAYAESIVAAATRHLSLANTRENIMRDAALAITERFAVRPSFGGAP